MNHRLYVGVIVFITCFLLAGCWDQRLLKEHSLILSIGYDKNDNGGILKTVSFPTGGSEGGSGGGKQGNSLNQSNVLSTTGHTVKDAEKRMEKSIPEKFDRTKTRIVILGKELATGGFYSTLDSLYRDLRGPIEAKLAIFDGKAKDGLNIKPATASLTSDLYAELLNSADNAGITVSTNLQEASSVVLSKDKDVVLPYIGLDEDETKPMVKGLALFHNDKMTGELNIKETSMFLMLSDQIAKHTTLNLKVTDDKKDSMKNFVNIAIRHNKQKMKINVDKGQIHAKVHVDLKIEIDEFAEDHLYNEKKAKALTKEIESHLNDLAKKTLAKMQEANSDALGIGGKVKAYHHATWEKIDWDKEYPDITLEATFNVKINRHGIIN